ncbi:MAG: S8 family serine peptidase [Pseudomonadota bacterium]
MKRLTVAMVCATVALCLTGTVQAGGPSAKRLFTAEELKNLSIPGMSAEAQQRALQTIAQARAAKAARVGAQNKVSGLLSAFAADADGNAQAQHPLIETHGSQISLRLTLGEISKVHLDELRAAGLHVSTMDPETGEVVAYCPVAGLHGALPGLAALANVRRIDPMLGALRRQGSVISEGDAGSRADVARARFGVTGAGVKLCAISDGTGGNVESAATGNLPINEDGTPAVELCPLNVDQGAEGTAMLEIMHDLAPGAELGFCPAFGPDGEQGLANAITYLAKDMDCDIIVDDVAFLTEPFFEDGPVARAVDRAFWGGALYLSSAGNGVLDHYERMFWDVNPEVDIAFPLVNLHDWGAAAGGPSDIDWAGLVASGGNFFAAFLQWPDKFGASANDFDLYIFDEFGFPAGAADPDLTDAIEPVFPIGANGVDVQDGSGNPLEIAFVVNNVDPVDPFGAIRPFFMVVDRFAGEPKLLEINFNGFFSVNAPEDYSVPEGSIWGHAAALTAISVAATGAVANNDGTPNPNLDIIEPFSSWGPSRIFFNRKGRAREGLRWTPTLTSIDGVSVTGFGGFPSTFFGTSASAPHAAAIAALMLEARPTLKPRGLRFLLKAASNPRGAPGFDFIWGSGLLNAEDAVESVAPTHMPGE